MTRDEKEIPRKAKNDYFSQLNEREGLLETKLRVEKRRGLLERGNEP